ncbi:cobalamin B12-binding domain-containing protein [bacterium]|nr:cobalamin B12-binding domain-containing protein [candidate division CSSED10-310 bacterium]
MKDRAFSIRIASQQSGLTPFLIRAWERRYHAVEPIRTPSNQRRYTPKSIERLTKLRRAVDMGYRIGDIAHMSDQELDGLVASRVGAHKRHFPMSSHGVVSELEWNHVDSSRTDGKKVVESQDSQAVVERYIEWALSYIDEMNESGLEALLSRASISMTQIEFLDFLVLPLTCLIGHRWHIGEIRISQEHMATWVIKSILSGLLRSYRSQKSAPMMVVTTPAGQHHEIGALAVAISGAHCGWNVTYLGPDLPAEEIAAMAVRTHAALVALSLVYPADDPLLPEELHRLKHLLPQQVPVIAGGGASAAYKEVMDRVGMHIMPSLVDFREYLNSFRDHVQGY